MTTGETAPDARDDEVERLASAASAGSAPAVEELLARYLPELRAYVRLRAGPGVRAREAVSDLVQSTCREVLQHAERFQHGGEAGFRRWLYATALRRILDKHAYHRAEKRDVAREVMPAPTSPGGSVPDLAAYAASFSTPSAVAVAREEAVRIEAAFDALSDEQRELIVQSRLLGVSHGELAESLGKSEGAVRVALHRALVKLAAVLDGAG